MGQLEIKHLKMIQSIANAGSMTRAAENLFITQSALSQQLKDIEGKLNIDLFFRTRKQMILTPTGKKLLKTAENVIEALEETELEIARIVSGDSGEFRVGTQCLFCYKWLPQVLSAFQAKFPNIEFELGSSLNPQKELAEKTFDVIISGTPFEEGLFSFSPLFRDQLVCIMNHDNPLSGQAFVRLDDFNGVCLISHADKTNNGVYQRLLKPNGIEPKKIMIISQPAAIMEMVAAGFGMAIVPNWAARDGIESDQIKALPITRQGIPITWGVVYLKNSTLQVYQSEFIRMVGKIHPVNSKVL